MKFLFHLYQNVFIILFRYETNTDCLVGDFLNTYFLYVLQECILVHICLVDEIINIKQKKPDILKIIQAKLKLKFFTCVDLVKYIIKNLLISILDS